MVQQAHHINMYDKQKGDCILLHYVLEWSSRPWPAYTTTFYFLLFFYRMNWAIRSVDVVADNKLFTKALTMSFLIALPKTRSDSHVHTHTHTNRRGESGGRKQERINRFPSKRGDRPVSSNSVQLQKYYCLSLIVEIHQITHCCEQRCSRFEK